MNLSHSINSVPQEIETNHHKPVKHVRSHDIPRHNHQHLTVYRTRSSSSNFKNSLLNLTSCALFKRRTTTRNEQISSVETPNFLTRTFSSSPSTRKTRQSQRISSADSTTLSLRKNSKKKLSSDSSGLHSPPTNPLRKEFSSSLVNLIANSSETIENNSMRNVKTPQMLRHILSMPVGPLERFSPNTELENSSQFVWTCEETTPEIDRTCSQLEIDEKPFIYRQQFQCEHFNWCGISELYGPVIISYKYFLDENQQRKLLGIIRTRQRTSIETLIDLPSTPIEILRQLCDQCFINDIEYFDPILAEGTQELLLKYDESLVSNQHKIGIIYQRENQQTEEDLFSNESHCSSMEKFLDLIGERVKLKDFRGFRGGLDVKSDQTGLESIYTEFENHEIMFHVSTLLPHSKIERQQLERKRHIGNDIVAIIFQEKPTSFNPEWITSQFLHVFLVIRPLNNENPMDFEVNVVLRDSVSKFGPNLGESRIFHGDSMFRRWLCAKLINGEIAACRSATFEKFQQRTKMNLFENLFRTIRENNRPIMDFILHQSQYKHECDLQNERQNESSIFGSVRRRFISSKFRQPQNFAESKSKIRSFTVEPRSNQTKSSGKFSSSLKSCTTRTESVAESTGINEMTNATSKILLEFASPPTNGQCTMFHFNGIPVDQSSNDL